MIRRLIILLLIVGCATEPAIEGCTTTTACNYNSEATKDDGSCLENDCNRICGGGATEDECGTSYSGTWYCQAETGANVGHLHAFCIDDTTLYFGKWDSKFECMDTGCQTNTVSQTMCIEPDLLCGVPQTHQGICAPDRSGGNPETGGVSCWLQN